MAHIQKKGQKGKNLRYEVRWRDQHGKHRTKGGFRIKAEAEDFMATVSTSARRGGTYYDPKQGDIIFRACAAEWLATRDRLKPRTRSDYGRMLAEGSAIDARFGSLPIGSITRQQIRDWVGEMKGQGLAASTIRNRFYLVSAVLSSAVNDQNITSNPCDQRKVLPSARSQDQYNDERLFLSAEQIERLADQLDFPWRLAILLTAYCGGLRAGELAGLQVGDLNLRQQQLSVRRTLVSVNGKLTVDQPKTKQSRRTVPLPIADEVRAHLAAHPRASDPRAWVFPWIGRGRDARLDWDQPMRHGTFYRNVFKPAVASAGLPAALRFHDLRHSFASIRVHEGWSAQQVSAWMGHTNVVTTLSIYTHLFEPDNDDVVRKLQTDRQDTLSHRTGGDNVISLRR